ncbi:MAG: hypothetical protein WBE68_12415 [Candidatus Nitrosopolaris sp.]
MNSSLRKKYYVKTALSPIPGKYQRHAYATGCYSVPPYSCGNSRKDEGYL